MAIAATSGYIADFQIGYLQREIIIHQASVDGGTDVAYDGTTGFAVGRLVKLTRNANDGEKFDLTAAANVTATSIGTATHIVAQSDDSLRNVTGDCIPAERYTTRSRGILANTVANTGYPDHTDIAEWKSIALWKIVNADDVKIIPIKHATISVTR